MNSYISVYTYNRRIIFKHYELFRMKFAVRNLMKEIIILKATKSWHINSGNINIISHWIRIILRQLLKNNYIEIIYIFIRSNLFFFNQASESKYYTHVVFLYDFKWMVIFFYIIKKVV